MPAGTNHPNLLLGVREDRHQPLPMLYAGERVVQGEQPSEVRDLFPFSYGFRCHLFHSLLFCKCGQLPFHPFTSLREMVYGIKAQYFKRIVLAIVTIQFQQLIVGIRFPRMMTDKEQIVLFRCHKSLLLLNIPTICECVCQPVQVVTDFNVRINRDFVFVITLVKVKWRKTGTILVIAFSECRVLDIRWKSENERCLLLFLFLVFGRILCFRVRWTNLWLFRILLFLYTFCSITIPMVTPGYAFPLLAVNFFSFGLEVRTTCV